MTGQINLYLTDKISGIKFFYNERSYDNYIIEIIMNKNIAFNDITNYQDEFDEKLRYFLNDSLNTADFYEETKSYEIILKHFNKEINLLKDATLLKLYNTSSSYFDELYSNNSKIFTIDEIENYININKIRDKKIVIDEQLDLNIDTYNNILKKYKNIKDNVLFLMNGNTYNYVTIDEYKRVIDIIYNVSNHIRKFNFSPFEEIMYTYDYVRQRTYKYEDKSKDNYGVSRDLSSVLLGNKIVCVGYAQIFSAILNNLGYKKNQVYYLQGKNEAEHGRNMVYIKDDKYKINGIYFFDPTFDSKNNDINDNINFYTYEFFARTLEEINKIDNGKYIDQNFNNITIDNIIDTYKVLDKHDYNNIDPKVAKAIRTFSNLLYNDEGISKYYCLDAELKILPMYSKKINKNLVEDRLEEMEKYLFKPIDSLKILDCIYEVKKQEYYEDMLNIDLNTKLLCLSIPLSNRMPKVDNESAFLSKILKKEICYSKDEIEKYIYDKEYEKDIERVKLTKILKKVLTKKD